MPISEQTRDEAYRLAKRYPMARSALLPLLHLVQSDEGYVSEDGVALCAEVLDLTKAEVGAVSSFYTMYKREPFGDYLLSVCTNPTCQIAGGQAIYDSYAQASGPGHIDREGAGVMVEHAECLGICDAAPVVQINYEMYGRLSHDEAMQMLADAKAGQPPASNLSGETPPTFRGIERELSGIDDGVDDHLIPAARRQAAASVPPAYRSGETDIPVTHPGGDPKGHGGELFRQASGLELEAQGPGEEPSPRPSDVDPGREADEAEGIAEHAMGVEQEMAEQATGGQPAPKTPTTAEKPESVRGGAKPGESAEKVPAGTEAEPGDEVAGGASADLDEPHSGGDVPREEDSVPGGAPTPGVTEESKDDRVTDEEEA